MGFFLAFGTVGSAASRLPHHHFDASIRDYHNTSTFTTRMKDNWDSSMFQVCFFVPFFLLYYLYITLYVFSDLFEYGHQHYNIRDKYGYHRDHHDHYERPPLTFLTPGGPGDGRRLLELR
jgi:hypothetical protein